MHKIEATSLLFPIDRTPVSFVITGGTVQLTGGVINFDQQRSVRKHRPRCLLRPPPLDFLCPTHSHSKTHSNSEMTRMIE